MTHMGPVWAPYGAHMRRDQIVVENFIYWQTSLTRLIHSSVFTFIVYDVFNHPEIGKNDPMHYMNHRRTDNLIYIYKKPMQQPIWGPYGAHMVLQHKLLHPKIVVKIINLTIAIVKRVFTPAKTCMETISNSVHFVRSLKIIMMYVFQRFLTLKYFERLWD